MSGQGQEIDLSPDVPQVAQDLANSKPDIRQSYETVEASSGDISGEIESAASSNAILDLGSGSYSMSSGVSLSGIAGIVGDGPDAATIDISGSHGYLFDFSGDTFVMEGVRVDISGSDTDAGLASVNYSNECWCEDVTLRGSRDKYAHDGPRMTFIIKGTESSARGYLHRCQFPDGGTNHSDEDGVGHAIGPNSDPGHYGTNVWHECLAANFRDNGFYVAYAEGPNILWNCVARNCPGANMRISTGDYIVGGRSESTDVPSDRACKCLTVDHSGTVRVVGLEMYGESPAVGGGAQLIQIRGDSEDVTLDRTVAHNNGGNFLARLDVADVQIDGGWWYQENQSDTAVQVGVRSGNANVNVSGDWRVFAEGTSEISGPITINGTSYSGTTTADEAGLGDPQPFPSFHFSGAESGVGDWTESGGGGGGGTGTGSTGGGGAGGTGGGFGGTGAGGGAGFQPLGTGQTGTATLDTGACGEVSVEVRGGLGFGGMGAGMGTAGWSTEGTPIQTNFDGMGSIGGGEDYSDTISESQADTVVTTAEELQTATQEASSGDTIFVSEDITLESPAEFSTDEITLASNRGVDGAPGAALSLASTGSNESQSSVVRMIGEASRVSGLIIEGPSGDTSDPDSSPYAVGVRLEGGGCEVDNCEIRSLVTAGVIISQTMTAAVHHNDFHDVGYGVRLNQSTGSAGGGGGGGAGGGSGGGPVVGGGGGSADCSPAVSEDN